MSMLRHLILRKLAERPFSGYGLATAIEQSTGKRPSYGSIYPLLEKLAQENIVTVKEEGRKKIYTLTKFGKDQVKILSEKRSSSIEKLKSHMLAHAECLGMDPRPLVAVMERMRKGEEPLGGISANMFAFRNLVFKMSNDGRTERNKKEINMMLKEMIQRLRKMK